MIPMIPKTPPDHHTCLHRINTIATSITVRATLTTSPLPLEETLSSTSTNTTSHQDYKSFCYSLTDKFIKRGLISSAQGLINRLINHSSSISDAIFAFDLANSHGLLHFNSDAYALLIRKFLNLGHPLVADQLYNAGFVERGIFPKSSSSSVLQSMVMCYCRLGKLDDAHRMLEQMLELGIRPASHLYRLLVFGFCKKGLVEKAEDLCTKMESQGLCPDRFMYTSVIYGYCKKGSMESACKFFQKMEAMGCEPDAYAYNTLIYGFFSSGSIKLGWEQCKRMMDRGLEPNVVTFGIIINKYCKDRKVDCAKEVLENSKFIGNVAPTVHCYTPLLSALLQENKLDEADGLFNEMLDSGVVPDRLTYLYLIWKYPKGQELRLALLILQALAKCGCTVDASMFHPSTTSSLHRDFDKDIELLFSDILGNSTFPACEILNILIRALCSLCKIDLSLHFLDKMIRHGVKPFVSTCNSLVKCLFQNGHVDFAQSITGLMINHGISPDVSTYSIMIKEHCNQADLFSALKVLEDMHNRGLKPSIAIYDSIIGAFCREQKLLDAEHIFQRMIKDGWVPSEFMYATLISDYSKIGRAFDALRLFEEMRTCGIRPNSYAYNALINGLVKKNMTEKAGLYLHNMLDDGIEPNVVLYTILINQFCKKGEVGFALKLFYLMLQEHIEPDLVTYGSLISGVCRNIVRTGRLYHFADKRAEQARNTIFNLLNRTSLTLVESNKRISCNSSSGLVHIALKLVNDIKDKGFVFDLHLYNAVVDGYCKADRMHDAYKHFGMLQKDGLVPNQMTYTILIDGHIRLGETDSAVKMFNKMNAEGCPPDKIAYNVLIKGLCRDERILEALSLVYTMNKRGLFPSKASYERLLKSLCCSSSDLAFKIFEEMLYDGYVPCTNNFNRLLCALCQGSKLVKAYKVFDVMFKRGKIPDKETKSLLVDACYKQKEYDLAVMFDENILAYET